MVILGGNLIPTSLNRLAQTPHSAASRHTFSGITLIDDYLVQLLREF